MSPEITVITAVHPGNYQWLTSAAASLTTQRTSLRWIVVADDKDTSKAELALANIPVAIRSRTRVLATRQPRCGAATARSIGLLEVTTPWIANLDSDDQWLPGGIDYLLDSCSAHKASWGVGHTVNATSDGIVTRPALAERTLSPGEFLDEAETVPLPWAQPGLIAKTAAVVALGGWPAFPFAEDTALTTALLAATTGRIESKTVYQYRKWPGQTSHEIDMDYVRHWHGLAVTRARRMVEQLGVLEGM